nr:MAG: hypothetical protein [Cressdnaviricota sp.]
MSKSYKGLDHRGRRALSVIRSAGRRYLTTRRAERLWEEAEASTERPEPLFELTARVAPRFNRMIAQGIEPRSGFGDPYYVDAYSRLGFDNFRRMQQSRVRQQMYRDFHANQNFRRGVSIARRGIAAGRIQNFYLNNRARRRLRPVNNRGVWQRRPRTQRSHRFPMRNFRVFGDEPDDEEGNVEREAAYADFRRRQPFSSVRNFPTSPTAMQARIPTISPALPRPAKRKAEVEFVDPLEFKGPFKKFGPNPPDDDDYNMI